MVFPLIGALGPLIALIRGPVASIIDKLIPDPDLRHKLKAEIEGRVLDHENTLAGARRDVLLAEMAIDSRLTRLWRPLLMYLIMLFLIIYGLVLPLADLIAGRHVPFAPRWSEIPPGLWQLLALGVGGYIGGRSLEKIASALRPRATPKPPARRRLKRRRPKHRPGP